MGSDANRPEVHSVAVKSDIFCWLYGWTGGWLSAGPIVTGEGGSSGNCSVLKRPNPRGFADRKWFFAPLFETPNWLRVASIRPNLELLGAGGERGAGGGGGVN